jgi:septal ring factor EnvC (AmiA/AmiB activator)
VTQAATDPAAYVALLREQVGVLTRVESKLDTVLEHQDRLEAIERLLERFIQAEERRVAILAAQEARKARSAEAREKRDQARERAAARAADAGQERCVSVFQRVLEFGKVVIATPWFGGAVTVALGILAWWLGYIPAPTALPPVPAVVAPREEHADGP